METEKKENIEMFPDNDGGLWYWNEKGETVHVYE
jgi:hypothetical protein